MARLPIAQDVRESRMPPQDPLIDSALLQLDAGGNLIRFNPQAVFLGLVPRDSQIPVPASRLPSFLTSALRELQQSASLSCSRKVVWAGEGKMPNHLQVDLLALSDPAGVPGGASCVASVRLLEVGEAFHQGSFEAANLRPWVAARAHEIKNSLVAVKTLVDLVLEKEPGMGIAQLVRQEIQRINSVVGQMLKTSGPEDTRFEWVDPHRIIEAVCQLMRPQLRDRSAQLNLSLEARGEEVWGDPHQIEQAVLNLVINGSEALRPQGELTIRTSIRDRQLPALRPGEAAPQRAYVITVTDNGCGIAPADLERLFDEFFTTKSGGTGLGLPITSQIMRAHGGLIEVKSEPTRGTTFELFFPLRSMMV